MWAARSPTSTSKPNSRPGSQAVTRHVVQYTGPISLRLTCPRNRAPSAGSVAPSSHSASRTSGENLPVLRTSAMRFQISSAGADMVTVAEPCMTTPLSGSTGHLRNEGVNVVRRQLFGDRGCHRGAWLVALILDVRVDDDDKRGLLLRQVHGDGLIAGQAAVLPDPPAEVKDPPPQSVSR